MITCFLERALNNCLLLLEFSNLFVAVVQLDEEELQAKPKKGALSLFLRKKPGTLHPSNYSDAEHFFGFCLQVFCQDGPLQKVDRCFAPTGSTEKVSFRTETRTHCQFGNPRSQKPIDY